MSLQDFHQKKSENHDNRIKNRFSQSKVVRPLFDGFESSSRYSFHTIKNSVILMCFLFVVVSCKDINKDNNNGERELIPYPEKHAEDTFEKTTTNVIATEEFEDIEFMGLNMELEEAIRPIEPKKLIQVFSRGKVSDEGNQTMDIEEKKLSNGDIKTIMVLDNLLDDSVKSEKYIMVLHQEKGLWQISSLKKNWRCWQGRGHADWGIALCD